MRSVLACAVALTIAAGVTGATGASVHSSSPASPNENQTRSAVRPEEPASPLAAVFVEGETLDYDLSWLRISGGSARMTIGAGGTAGTWRITSVGASSPAFSKFYRVRDEVESIVDRATFSTLRYRKNLSEGSRRKDETTVIEGGVATRNGASKPVPSPVFDPLSIVYYLRTLDLTTGKTHRFTLYADGKVYTVAADVERRETTSTPAGTFKTVVVSPQMETEGVFRDDKGKLTIWYSDDERHLVVKMVSSLKIGSISATLRKVTRGVSTIEPIVGSDSK